MKRWRNYTTERQLQQENRGGKKIRIIEQEAALETEHLIIS